MSNQVSFKQTIEFRNLQVPDPIYHKLLSVTGKRLDLIAGFLPIHIGAVILFKENISVNLHRCTAFPIKKDEFNLFVNINTELEELDDLGYLLYETVLHDVKEQFDIRLNTDGEVLKSIQLIYVDEMGRETTFKGIIKSLHKTTNIVGFANVAEMNPNFFIPQFRLTEQPA